MTPEEILAQPPLTLSQRQREFYFENGYLAAQNLIPRDVLETLRKATRELVDESAGLTASNDRFDLSPDHGAQAPRPRRIRAAVDQHPVYWQFASSPLMTDIAADLVGPNVKFHSSKLNFKWPGGDEIKWHQDIPAWPHSNFSPVTIGIYLEDVATADGPLAAVPRSHDRDLFDHFGENGAWTGYIADRDLTSVALDTADDMKGPAGTLGDRQLPHHPRVTTEYGQSCPAASVECILVGGCVRSLRTADANHPYRRDRSWQTGALVA